MDFATTDDCNCPASDNGVVLLDGGMGRELERRGAPFRRPEWSALTLMEAPHFVYDAHLSFARAGCDVLTVSAYACVPFHMGEKLFEERGPALAGLAASLAQEAANKSAAEGRATCPVAGSLPPPFGSYRPDLFKLEEATSCLSKLALAQAPYVDLWLAETMSSTAELRAVVAALASFPPEMDEGLPLWASFTLRDSLDEAGHARLRSGEAVAAAVVAAAEANAVAVLFNCSKPEVMLTAVREARAALDQPAAYDGNGAGLHSLLSPRPTQGMKIGVYANNFSSVPEGFLADRQNVGMRDDLGPRLYADAAAQWVQAGATIVGGCCGIGPEYIAMLDRTLRQSGTPSAGEQTPSGCAADGVSDAPAWQRRQ
jgi:S-methylmethionine-dependent homocysteine/selenocysteine methylase